MNTKSFFLVTLNNLRQFTRVCVMLSLFVVCFSRETKAETYLYDELNRVIKVTETDGSYIEYKYDANGNVTSKTYHANLGTEQPGTGQPGTEQPGTEQPGTGQPGTGQAGTGQDGALTLNPKILKRESQKGTKIKTSNATYVITSDGKTCTVALKKFTNKKKTSYIVPEYVKYKGAKYKVTKISANAFYGNTKLKKVTIEIHVKSIGQKAFYKCSKLKTIKIKTKKLTFVGKNAFKGIYKKAKIKVPKKKYKAYKKLLKGKGQKTTVKISKY